MWHHLHLVAAPVEFLLGLFCILTAIVLYPGEEGKIQSKFEDFWIRVDDYQKLALSRHAAFMTQVAKVETRFLDRVFGLKLISARALGVSYCFAVGSLSIVTIIQESGQIGHSVLLSAGLLIGSIAVGAASVFLQAHKIARRTIIIAGLIASAAGVAINETPTGLGGIGVAVTILSITIQVLGGFVCDVAFVAVTRQLLRWAGQMTSSLKVLATVFCNLLLAVILTSPLLVYYTITKHVEDYAVGPFLLLIASSNIVNAGVALLFVLLAVLLLIHRAAWPILTRTLFRMADVGTKGRRAILTTVGVALLAAGISGKVPELLQKLIEKLGG